MNSAAKVNLVGQVAKSVFNDKDQHKPIRFEQSTADIENTANLIVFQKDLLKNDMKCKKPAIAGFANKIN